VVVVVALLMDHNARERWSVFQSTRVTLYVRTRELICALEFCVSDTKML